MAPAQDIYQMFTKLAIGSRREPHVALA